MGKISGYPVVTSMNNNSYFLIDTFPITDNSTSIISKANALTNVLSNPMTTVGDNIYGGASGVPTRLAGNTTSTKNFLVQTGTGSASQAPLWGTIASGDIPTLNQSTTGNAATATAANGLTSATTTVAVSSATAPSSGQVLTATSSTAAHWATATSGFTNPMTTSGDTIYGAASGTATRLAKGSNNQVLTLLSGIPAWATPSAATATFFNVKTYGAYGNGTNDDTAAIQSAINAALASQFGSGTVYFPAGTYIISSTLQCSSATLSASGVGVILRGDGHGASRIFKTSSFGYAVGWLGNGGPSGNPTSYGGMVDISIEGNATTGGLVSTTSANQMFFRGASFTGSNGSAWDFNTMQDSYFSQCTFNSNGLTSAPVVNIYGSSSGTCNMLWFDQVRVESFPGYGISITYGSGNSNNNNGMFFNQLKLESTSATKDLFYTDASAQQLNFDGVFLSQGNSSGGSAINGINTAAGSLSAHNVWMNVSTSGQALNVIWVNNPGGGPIDIDNIYVDNTLASGGGIVKLDGISATNNFTRIGGLGGSNTTITGDSSGPTLGWGQPTHGGSTTGFTAATGTAVLAGSTFTGGVGSTTYTLTDIVAALKKLGAIVQ